MQLLRFVIVIATAATLSVAAAPSYAGGGDGIHGPDPGPGPRRCGWCASWSATLAARQQIPVRATGPHKAAGAPHYYGPHGAGGPGFGHGRSVLSLLQLRPNAGDGTSQHGQAKSSA